MRAELRAALPPYMVPSRYETRDVLPRLSSGKVNRNALKKEPLDAPSATAEAQEEPRDRTEALLLEAATKSPAAADHPLRRRFLHGSRRPFAAGGAFHLDRAPDAGSGRRSPCRTFITARTLRAIAALLDEKAARRGGPKDLSFTPPPLLPPLPVRPRAGHRSCRSCWRFPPRNGWAFSSPTCC